MNLVIVILAISLFLDGIISNVVPLTSFLLPLFTVVSLVIVFPYFEKKDVGVYFKMAVLLGFIYDVIYTDMFLLHASVFLILAGIIYFIANFITSNFLNTMFTTIIVIVSYRFITYVISLFILKSSFSFELLFISIYKSLVINVVYCLIMYFNALKISSKYKIYKAL